MLVVLVTVALCLSAVVVVSAVQGERLGCPCVDTSSVEGRVDKLHVQHLVAAVAVGLATPIYSILFLVLCVAP